MSSRLQSTPLDCATGRQGWARWPAIGRSPGSQATSRRRAGGSQSWVLDQGRRCSFSLRRSEVAGGWRRSTTDSFPILPEWAASSVTAAMCGTLHPHYPPPNHALQRTEAGGRAFSAIHVLRRQPPSLSLEALGHQHNMRFILLVCFCLCFFGRANAQQMIAPDDRELSLTLVRQELETQIKEAKSQETALRLTNRFARSCGSPAFLCLHSPLRAEFIRRSRCAMGRRITMVGQNISLLQG